MLVLISIVEFEVLVSHCRSSSLLNNDAPVDHADHKDLI